MPLALLTPTRDRWPSLYDQARAIAPQLAPDDLWLIGCDRSGNDRTVDKVERIAPRKHLAWLRFDYSHPSNVNRLRNALASFAPPTHDLVEIDDHDLIAPYALSEIRHAFDAGYDYIFGWHEVTVPIVYPDGSEQIERWPTVEREYHPGDFARHAFDAIGLRAVRRSLWDKLGGWGLKFPGGHYNLATRAESAGAKIVCLQRSLSTVRIEPERSICGLYREM